MEQTTQPNRHVAALRDQDCVDYQDFLDGLNRLKQMTEAGIGFY